MSGEFPTTVFWIFVVMCNSVARTLFSKSHSLSVFAVSNLYRHCGFIDAHQQCWNTFRMFTTLLHHASCDGATVSYRLGVTVSCRLGATVSYLLGATLSYRLGAIGPRFCTIFVYPLTFLVGPKVFSGKTSLLNSVQWSGRAHVGQIPEAKPYSYQTLLLGSAENWDQYGPNFFSD